jgi:hypothetical protein
MASVANISGGVTENSTGLTVSHNNNGNGPLIVAIQFFGRQAGDTVTVTYNGQPLSEIAYISGGESAHASLWEIESPAFGTHDLVVGISASRRHRVVVFSTNDAGPSSAGDTQEGGNFGSSDATGSTLSPTTDEGGLIIDCLYARDQTSVTEGANQTKVDGGNVGGVERGASSWRLSESTSTNTSWSWSDESGYAHVAVYLEGSDEPDPPEDPEGHHFTISTPLS